VVLTWAVLKRCLKLSLIPLLEMMQLQDADFVITRIPKAVNPEITKDSKIEYQNKAFENADFIYAKKTGVITKEWSDYKFDPNWTVTADKMN
jgi:N-succinyl-L-ornithine transcarbamylase